MLSSSNFKNLKMFFKAYFSSSFDKLLFAFQVVMAIFVISMEFFLSKNIIDFIGITLAILFFTILNFKLEYDIFKDELEKHI